MGSIISSNQLKIKLKVETRMSFDIRVFYILKINIFKMVCYNFLSLYPLPHVYKNVLN